MSEIPPQSYGVPVIKVWPHRQQHDDIKLHGAETLRPEAKAVWGKLKVIHHIHRCFCLSVLLSLHDPAAGIFRCLQHDGLLLPFYSQFNLPEHFSLPAPSIKLHQHFIRQLCSFISHRSLVYSVQVPATPTDWLQFKHVIHHRQSKAPNHFSVRTQDKNQKSWSKLFSVRAELTLWFTSNTSVISSDSFSVSHHWWLLKRSLDPRPSRSWVTVKVSRSLSGTAQPPAL